ncbi:branched chain alpha-keto acid dehydrogenase [Sarcoptes scabiei]|nr:branched chain alpha-keto acid dehydrogenase [Sarcoptes scabiei]
MESHPPQTFMNPSATMNSQQRSPLPDAIDPYNTRVIKEPRGMIRLIQLVFAVLAFSITSSFDTETSFTISCYKNTKDASNRVLYQKKSTYQVEYPFDMSATKLTYLESCVGNSEEMKDKFLNIDFSSSAKFFVTTGVFSFIYTICCLYVYIKLWHLYETNPFFPVVDLAITTVFSIFWLAGASAWAINVSDLKHYTGPRYLIQQLDHCNKTLSEIEYDCFSESPGKWSPLYISLIFGFANLFIWSASIWFVYKETHFHRPSTNSMMMAPGTGVTSAPQTMDQTMMSGQIASSSMYTNVDGTAQSGLTDLKTNMNQFGAGGTY